MHRYFQAILLLPHIFLVKFVYSSLSPVAIQRGLPNIATYLRVVLKREKLSEEAESLRMRYDTILASLEQGVFPSFQRRFSVEDDGGYFSGNRIRGTPSLSLLSISLSLSETFSLTLTTSICLSAPLLLLSLSFSPLPVVNTIYSCWIVGSFCLWRYHYGSCLLGKLLSWKVLLPTWFLIYGHQSSLLISITDSCTYPFNVAFSLSLPLSLSLSLSPNSITCNAKWHILSCHTLLDGWLGRLTC